MSDESVFRTIQLGKESSYGDGGNGTATIAMAVDPGAFEFTLDRAVNIPDVDAGGIGRNYSGVASSGVRQATSSGSIEARFEEIGQWLEMAVGTGVVSGTASPYTHTYAFDWGSDSVLSRFIEVKADQQDFLAKGVVVTSIDLGFDNIGGGQNVPWKISVELLAADYSVGTATASVSFPGTAEVIEGHYSTVSEGPIATAFASLSELSSSLVSYHLRVDNPTPLRPYGGTADTAAAHGRQKRTSTVTAMLAVGSTALADSFTIYNVSGSVPTPRRWRVAATGSGTKSLTIDHQLLLKEVKIEPDGRDGERLLSVTAEAIYDSTLTTDCQIAIAGLGIAALP